ncbi:hypothetical protein BDD12DRAFT_864162 [Trichophaea hybrida]|nr:hypothetical protein BDD12DRAFT_864162 [Trichophaea hybrida]
MLNRFVSPSTSRHESTLDADHLRTFANQLQLTRGTTPIDSWVRSINSSR